MAQELNELRTYIRQLKHAVATTTCEKTLDALRQMQSEAEAKLCAIEPCPPAGRHDWSR
jgi:ribosomal protein S20